MESNNVMDPNWIMAIIALSAVLSPTIVSIIDNVFKYKTKQLELYFPNKQKSLSIFVEKAMYYYSTEFYKGAAEYIKAKNDLFVYFEISSNNLFKQLEDYAKNQDFDNYKETINTIVKRLSQQLKK